MMTKILYKINTLAMHQIQETTNFFINTHALRELNLHISIFQIWTCLIYKILYVNMQWINDFSTCIILTTFTKTITKKDRKIINKCFNVYTEINMNTWIFTWLKIWSQVTVIFQKCVKYNVYEYKKVLRGK